MKNILFLFPDQHRGDWLPYEKEQLKKFGIDKLPLNMPNIKNLMNCGTTFTNCISPSPLCAPARACLASGKSYENCGVPNNGTDYPLDLPTFYQALRDKNYSVGGVGKFDVHKKTMFWGLDGWVDSLATLGFTTAIDNAGKLDAGHSGIPIPQDPYMKLLHEKGWAEYHAKDITTRKKSVEPTQLPDELYCDNYIGDNAINMIRGFEKDKPWFIQVNFSGPHDPFDITKSMRQRWENVQFDQPCEYEQEKNGDTDIQGIRQNYAAMLENIDRNIGLILDEVKKRGELDNTLIVYSSDHGEMLGDFNKYAKSKPERGSVHIPLIVKVPNKKQPLLCDSLVELQDLANTFLDWADTKLDSADDSYSILPLINGEKSCNRKVEKSAINNWKVVQNNSEKIVYENNIITQVYDLKDDVWQENNLIITDTNKANSIIENLTK